MQMMHKQLIPEQLLVHQQGAENENNNGGREEHVMESNLSGAYTHA